MLSTVAKHIPKKIDLYNLNTLNNVIFRTKSKISEQTTKKEAISTNKKIILFSIALLSVLFLTAQTCTASYLRYDYNCSDGLKSLGEADVDCGGAYCDSCSEGDDCDDNDDCASGLECDKTTDTCDDEGDGDSDADETAAGTDSLDATSSQTKAAKTSAICDDDLANLMGNKFLWALDFEDLDDAGWIRDWGKPTGTAEKVTPNFELDTSVTHTGKRSLKISSTGTETYGNINSKAIRVTPGEEYTISFWIKGTDVVIEKRPYLAIVQKTGVEIPLGVDQSKSTYCFTEFLQGTYDWIQVSGTCQIPADHDALVYAMILFQGGSGTIWLDDIVVTQTELPETTIEVETRTKESAAPTHHYFLRNKPVEAKAIVRNHKGTAGTYTVKAKLSYCDETVQEMEKTVSVTSYDRVEVPLMTLYPSKLALGDYLLIVTLEQGGRTVDSFSYPVGFRSQQKPTFLFSLGHSPDIDPASSVARMDKYKSHYLTPLFYSEPPSFAIDAALSRGLSFTVRLMPEMTIAEMPKRLRPDGEDSTTNPDGLSDENKWSAAAKEIGDGIARVSHFQTFFPRVFTSDDFTRFSGWDWADKNTERFKQLTGIDAPTPSEFNGKENPFAVTKFTQQKGAVDSNEPWLAYNRFLSKDVLGSYNKAVTATVIKTNSDALIGPIPGGMQWPVFSTALGQYPPYNFGKNGFSMISYYMYLLYWQPLTAYVFWTDIAQMGNRDLPTYVMPDAMMPESSYFQNIFYLLLASGVDGIVYYLDSAIPPDFEPSFREGAHPEFWEAAKSELGPLAKKFGSLFVQLEPEQKQVGLLASFTTATYNTAYPLQLVCAYSNLLMSHIDIEVVSEEEILAGRLSQYDALILSDVDWLRSDVVQLLTDQETTQIILDKSTEVPLSGNQVHKMDFDFVEGSCAGTDPDYGKADHLATIRTELNKIVSSPLEIDKDTVIYRTFSDGEKKYLWLVDVHSRNEYKKLWSISSSVSFNVIGSDEYLEKVRSEMKSYLQQQGVYDGVTTVNIKVKTDKSVKVVDVLTEQEIDSTFENGWTTFKIEIERLKGKLISFS